MDLPKTFDKYLKTLSDERCACDVKIPISDVAIVLICAFASGLEDPKEISQYAHNRGWFHKRFGIERIPSESTMRRVLRIMKPTELGLAALGIMREQWKTQGDIIAIDGQAIRSSERIQSIGQKIRILSAYETQTSTTIGQLEVGEKTNEIPVMLDLLDLLDLGGKVITADAMHCQKKTCRKIIEAEGDYVLQVKSNQGDLYEAIQQTMDSEIESGSSELQIDIQADRGHGREEIRCCYSHPVEGWYDKQDQWRGLNLFIAMDRCSKRNGKQVVERSYYISSLLGTAKHLNQLIREHWKIESMHWMLDITFHEDACRIRDPQAQFNMNILRKLALSLHKHFVEEKQKQTKAKKKMAIKTSMLDCLMNPDLLLEVILQDLDLELLAQ